MPTSATTWRTTTVDIDLVGCCAVYHIRDDAADAARFYASNGVFTGLLKDVFESLQRKLRIEWLSGAEAKTK